MYAINLLAEGTHGPDLKWLLLVVLIVFFIVVIVGWLTSRKNDDVPAEASEAEASSDPDDLTKLEGIGPKVAGILAEAGYDTYAKLAAAVADDVDAILKDASLQMMDPAGWIEQAELAAKGDMEGLEKLQDELKGGRRA